MLKKLRIRNFKGWKDTGTIRMAPISLFFGANSSGKSSIGQFLMMLKQTVESPDRKVVFYPGGQYSAVQLGSYREMVFHRDIENKISFEYEWSLSDIEKIKDPISKEPYEGNELAFSAQVGSGDKDQSLLLLNYLNYTLKKDSKNSFSVGLARNGDLKNRYKIEAEKYILKRRVGRQWPSEMPVRFYGFPDEVIANHQNAEFVQSLNLRHEQLFRSIFYLGPLRTKAERLYSWTGMEPGSVGYAGENTVAAILAAKNRKINLGNKRPRKSFEEVIALKLKQMGLIEDFNVKPISDLRQEYEVKVRIKGSRDYVDLPDVGFGISQVLPVLVQCFYAPAGSIIIMEQPEIHLHPSAQSALADVMIDAIHAKENFADRNIQLIIETHSEHFLRRMQRRIAENKVSQDSVSAYFADITKAPATLKPLEIDIFGNIANWPKDFFGDEMGDIAGQAKAAMRKKILQRKKTDEVA